MAKLLFIFVVNWALFFVEPICADATLDDLERELSYLNQESMRIESLMGETETRMADSPFTCQGRLTVESGVPIPTTDRANQSTLYFTPYQGSKVALYNGTTWSLYNFSEISLALSGLTGSTNYDVFLYDNSGVLTLELTAWSGATTRATALTTQDGVYVRNGATTRRYLGTIRATSATQTQDTQTQRFVWNFYHRARRTFALSEATNSWAYATAAFRSVANNANNHVEYVSGLDETPVLLKAMVVVTSGATNVTNISTSFGWNSTTTSFTQSPRGGSARDTIRQQMWAGSFDLDLGIGYVDLNWIEYGNATSCTFYGDDGGDARLQSGLLGWVHG